MQGCNAFFCITPDKANTLCVFAINRGQIENRLDVQNIFYCQIYQNRKTQKISLGSLTIEEPCYGTSATAIERTCEEQPKYIRITDFDDYGIEDNHEYMTAETYVEKHLLQNNDILFARTGGTVGKTYFYDGSIGRAIFAGYCIRFRFDGKKVLPKYIYWCTKTKQYTDWIKGIQRPSGQPNINREEYKSFEIPLPNIEMQHRVVEFMDAAFAKRQAKLKQADTIRESILTYFAETLNIRISRNKPELVTVLRMEQINATATRRLDTKCYDKKFQIMRDELSHSVFPSYQLRDLIIDNTGGDWGYDEGNESDTRIKCLVLRATEISNKNNINIRVDKAQCRQIEKRKLAAMNLEIGDVIIEKSGGSIDQPVGRVIFVDQLEYKGYPLAYSNFLTKIKINHNLVDPYYLFEYLRFIYGIGLTEVMQNQTNGIRNLIIEEFLEQTVIVPENNYEIGQRIYQLRSKARQMELDAEQEWQAAKSQFEKELLGV
ncbi:MAG: restriction endonuclease subunit S [Clostridia bacterium]|nr:restriction endonuclease subunit S [Clostridia bacterium]